MFQISTVSLSVQPGTLPLVWYYFGQFPLYFLVTNLIVIPLAPVILGLGIITIISGPWEWGYITGWLMGLLIGFMNMGVSYIASLPGSTMAGMSWDILQVGIIYLFFFQIWKIIRKPRFWYFLMIFLLLITFSFYSGKKKQKLKEDHLILFPQNNSVEIFSNGQSWGFSNNKDHLGAELNKGQVYKYFNIVKTVETNASITGKKSEFIVWKNKVILILRESPKDLTWPEITIDLLVITDKKFDEEFSGINTHFKHIWYPGENNDFVFKMQVLNKTTSK